MSNKDKHSPCRECGGDDLHCAYGGGRYQIQCRTCGFFAPTKPSESDAWEAWDNREDGRRGPRTLNACPFQSCGKIAIQIERVHGSFGDYYAWCPSCEACGPSCSTEGEAIAAWNSAKRGGNR